MSISPSCRTIRTATLYVQASPDGRRSTAPPSASADEARQKLTYDLFYVKNLSLFLDLRILLKTFWTITSGGGVR